MRDTNIFLCRVGTQPKECYNTKTFFWMWWCHHVFCPNKIPQLLMQTIHVNCLLNPQRPPSTLQNLLAVASSRLLFAATWIACYKPLPLPMLSPPSVMLPINNKYYNWPRSLLMFCHPTSPPPIHFPDCRAVHRITIHKSPYPPHFLPCPHQSRCPENEWINIHKSRHHRQHSHYYPDCQAAPVPFVLPPLPPPPVMLPNN